MCWQCNLCFPNFPQDKSSPDEKVIVLDTSLVWVGEGIKELAEESLKI